MIRTWLWPFSLWYQFKALESEVLRLRAENNALKSQVLKLDAHLRHQALAETASASMYFSQFQSLIKEYLTETTKLRSLLLEREREISKLQLEAIQRLMK